MNISRAWLQRYFETSLPDTRTLADALTFHAFEIESVENDILDVKVTPNRGHDALSHRGIAKELSAILNMQMKSDPLRAAPSLEPKNGSVALSLAEPALCKRYIAGYLRTVTVGPSPDWLKMALESVGQRSINNVVDATNFVMFDLGQPLHAFDAGKLSTKDGSYAIGVRKAKTGETMTALDDKEYLLSDSMLVITDAHRDAPIGIAGVKGGAPAGITEDTTDIIIESANFDGVSVRRTAAALKLRTDASARFEQNISPELAAYGMRAAASLICELAGGELAGFSEEYPVREEQKPVSVSTERVNAVLGTHLPPGEVGGAFSRLGLAHVQTNSTFEVHPPFERLDITIPEDLVEEVGRLVGYDKIPATELPEPASKPAINTNFHWSERIREYLVSEGFSEVYTSVFSEEGDVAVLNKVDSHRPYLRRELLTGLREGLDKNMRNKDLLGVPQVRIFEVGTVWRGSDEMQMLGLAVEKQKTGKSAAEYLNALCHELGISAVIADDPNEVLEVPLSMLIKDMPVPESYDELPASTAERYKTFSRYPFIVRDIALWTPAGTNADDVHALIRAHAGELLVRSSLFDTFEKDGRLSLAFRLVFQSYDRTLFDGDANERMAAISNALKEKGYEIR